MAAGELWLRDLEEMLPNGELRYKVPRTTMVRWIKDDWIVMTAKGKRGIHGEPHWKVEAEMRGRTELTRAGVQTALGAAELNLMCVFATAARNGSPYLEEEIHDILKTTLIVLELRNRVTGELYAEDSDIRSLVAGFLERCKLRGIVLNWRAGRKLSLQRWLRSCWEVLDRYSKQVASPVLRDYQLKHQVKLGLLDVGNFDETQIDLCEFAENGNFLMLQWFGNNVVVPYEQCPHITLTWGYIGRELMVCMVIKKGPDDCAPHPHHCQLLESDRFLTLAQSLNGWTNGNLTVGFMKQQYDHPDVPLGPHRAEGAAPAAELVTHHKVLNLDGHAAHIYNDELKEGFAKHNILVLSPPAHTSAPSQRLPGTQQADLPKRDGGGIALTKARFRNKMYRQWRSALKRPKGDPDRGKVSMSEVLPILEMSLKVTPRFPPALSISPSLPTAPFHSLPLPWPPHSVITRQGILQRQARAALPLQPCPLPPHLVRLCALPFLQEAWKPSMAVHMTATVGYFINQDGFLDYDILKEHRQRDGSCGITAENEQSDGSSSSEPSLGSTRSCKKDVRIEAQCKVDQELYKARKEIEASVGAVQLQNTPVVEAPTLPVRKPRKDAPNRYGCVVGAAESSEETRRAVEANSKAVTDKEKKTDQFWAKHRDTIKAAEVHLAEACGSPGAPLKEKTKGHAGYVATLKALLYISRAGKPVPPTWNNKPGADRGESKLLREVRAALRENEETRLPMTPQRL